MSWRDENKCLFGRNIMFRDYPLCERPVRYKVGGPTTEGFQHLYSICDYHANPGWDFDTERKRKRVVRDVLDVKAEAPDGK